MLYFMIIVLPSILFGIFISEMGVSVIDNTLSFLILAALNGFVLVSIYNGVK